MTQNGLTAFERGLVVSRIVGGIWSARRLQYEAVFEGPHANEPVYASDANIKCPGKVIAFYEQLLGDPESAVIPEEDVVGFNQGLVPLEIIRRVKSDQAGRSRQLFQMVWRNSTRNYVDATEAKQFCPQTVIAFYEGEYTFPIEGAV